MTRYEKKLLKQANKASKKAEKALEKAKKLQEKAGEAIDKFCDCARKKIQSVIFDNEEEK